MTLTLHPPFLPPNALSIPNQTGHLMVVKSLLTKGVEINVRNNNGESSLMWAAYRGHGPVVEALIAHGAAVDGTSKNGSSALISAAYKG